MSGGQIGGNSFWNGQNPFDILGSSTPSKKTQGAQPYDYNLNKPAQSSRDSFNFNASNWNAGPSSDMFQSNFLNWGAAANLPDWGTLNLMDSVPNTPRFSTPSKRRDVGAKSMTEPEASGKQPANQSQQGNSASDKQVTSQNPQGSSADQPVEQGQQGNPASNSQPPGLNPQMGQPSTEQVLNAERRAIENAAFADYLSGFQPSDTIQVALSSANAASGALDGKSVQQVIADAVKENLKGEEAAKAAEAANQKTEAQPDAPPADEPQISSSDALYEKLKTGKVVIQPGDVDKIDFEKIMAMDPETAKQIIGNMDLTTGHKLPVWQRDILAVKLAKAMNNKFVDGLELSEERAGGLFGWGEDNLEDDDVSSDDMNVMQKAIEKTGNAELSRIFGVIKGSHGVLGNLSDAGMTKLGALKVIEDELKAGKGEIDLGKIIQDARNK